MLRNIYLAASVAAVVAVAVVPTSVLHGDVQAKANGNNGTVKVHEKGTPRGTESNDPKVCVFNVEGYGFDKGQAGHLVFKVQGGDKPTGKDAGPYKFGPADAKGYYETQYFTLKPGHYKVTLYGKDIKGDVDYSNELKAKSKVFKVECTKHPVTPLNHVKEQEKKKEAEKPVQTPATKPVQGGGGAKEAEAAIPAELPKTGAGAISSLVAVAASAATYAGTLTAKIRRSSLKK